MSILFLSHSFVGYPSRVHLSALQCKASGRCAELQSQTPMAKQSGLCCLGEHTQMVPSWNFLVDLSPAFPSGGNSVPTEGPRSHRLCCCHLSLPLWSSHLPEVPGKAGGQSARWKQLVFRGLLLGQETLSRLF
jgi:hypothetical protein